MKNLPANIILEKNKLSTASAWLVLLEITLTDIEDSGGPTVFRLVKNNEDIIFDGNTFTKFNFQLEPIAQAITGQINTVMLRVSNVTRLLEAYLQELDGGIGSTVKIIVVNSDLLAENYSELEMTFEVLKTSTTVLWVEFTLGVPSPLRQRFPLNKYLALHCNWTFTGGDSVGDNVECAYIGAEATCNRTLADCRLRNNETRFGGFPGMRSGGVRIV